MVGFCHRGVVGASFSKGDAHNMTVTHENATIEVSDDQNLGWYDMDVKVEGEMVFYLCVMGKRPDKRDLDVCMGFVDVMNGFESTDYAKEYKDWLKETETKKQRCKK